MSAKSKKKIAPQATKPASETKTVSYSNPKIFTISDRKQVFIIGLIAFLVYILSVNNGYNLDDNIVTKDHPFVSKGIAGIPEILTNPYYNIGGYRFDYRPIPQITFAIEQSLFGQNPAISHFVSVVLYALLCVWLFLVLRFIFPQLPRAFLWLGMILFVVHPLHSEVVNNLKSRDEILSLAFGLGFLWMAVSDFRTPGFKFKACAFLFLLLAMMAKVSILPLILFFPLYVLFYRKSDWYRPALWVMPALYVFFWLGYFVVVNGIIFPTERTLTFTEMPLPADPTISDKLGVIVPTIFFYVKMMLAPWPLCSYYGYNTMPFTEWKAIVVLAFLLLSVLLFFRGVKDRRMYALIPAWFIASGFLFYNLGYYYTGIVSERAAFIMSIPGSLGVVMLVGALVQRKDISLVAPSKPTMYIVYGIALVFGAISFMRVFDWKDPVTLYAKDLKHYPNSGHLNFLQGVNYDIKAKEAKDPQLERGYIDTAFFHFNRTLVLEPDRPVSLTYVGRYFMDYYSNLDTAHTLLSRAWSIREGGETAYELGRAKSFLGRWDEALPILEKAIELDTSIYWTWYFLAQAYYEAGRLEDAFQANENLSDLPEMAEYYHLNAGNFYYRSGRVEESMPWFVKAVENGTRDPRLLQEMRAFYGARGERAVLQWLEGLE